MLHDTYETTKHVNVNNNLVFQEQFNAMGGMRVTVAIKDVLEVCTGPFKVEVYQTVPFGKMLVIDGVIQLTEFDNFAYHEMIAHVPMNAHPNPERVLVVGGGDGGALKEILKHDSVKEAVLCEISEDVVNFSKKHFPDIASGFNDQRTTLLIQDAAEYIKTKENYFDVICVDSSDPVGPANVLFTKEFYQNLERALTSNGIVTTQSESMFYDKNLIAQLYSQNKEIFAHAGYYFTLVPTYPSGTIGFSFCSKKYSSTENLDPKRIEALGQLKYYNKAIHTASFQLPEFIKSLLKK